MSWLVLALALAARPSPRPAPSPYPLDAILAKPVTAGGVALLVSNGVNVGVAGGLFVAEGEGAKFFGLILPHGLLELTAVAVAAGAGLQMGWALLAPGDRTRAAALAEEGRRSVVLVLGTILAFVVAGLVEGFVTPAPIPTPLRVAVGVLAWAGFLLWVLGLGRCGLNDVVLAARVSADCSDVVAFHLIHAREGQEKIRIGPKTTRPQYETLDQAVEQLLQWTA